MVGTYLIESTTMYGMNETENKRKKTHKNTKLLKFENNNKYINVCDTHIENKVIKQFLTKKRIV